MSDNVPLKVIDINGHIDRDKSEGKIDFVVYTEYCNIFEGVWQIALLDLTIISDNFTTPVNPTRQKFFKVCTNFVMGEYVPAFQRECVPIARFQYSEIGEKLIRFNPPIFFHVNNPMRSFQLLFQTYGDKLTLDFGFKYIATLGLRRVK